jgi:photosynthesis system II assembly factor YCF48-like protein
MEKVPKIVARRLAATKLALNHPDPNQISAFVEKSLGKHERVQVLEHLAQCTNCREIVSLSNVQPDIAGTNSAAPASLSWLSWPVLRWGAVMACVVLVAAVVTLRQRQETRQIAAAITEGKPAAETQASVPNNAIDKQGASLQAPNAEAKTASVSKQTMSPQKPMAGNPAPPSPVEMADARTGSPLTEVVPGRAKDAPAEPQDAQAEESSADPSSRNRSSMSAGPASDAVIPGDLPPRWTLSSDGTLQRSLDSGRTWEAIPVSSQMLLRALAANGLDIWVGGDAGALFHSSDAGQHWTQVQPTANGETIEDDIIGVEFTDTLHGKLTTSGEQTWTTADAGQNWQKQ